MDRGSVGGLTLSPGGSGNSFNEHGLILDGNGWAFYDGINADLNELGANWSIVFYFQTPLSENWKVFNLFSSDDPTYCFGVGTVVIPGDPPNTPPFIQAYMDNDYCSDVRYGEFGTPDYVSLLPGTRYLFVLTFNGEHLGIYLNGVRSTRSDVGNSINSDATPGFFTWGSADFGSTLPMPSGSILKLAGVLKDTVWTDQEVMHIFTFLSTPPLSTLINARSSTTEAQVLWEAIGTLSLKSLTVQRSLGVEPDILATDHI